MDPATPSTSDPSSQDTDPRPSHQFRDAVDRGLRQFAKRFVFPFWSPSDRAIWTVYAVTNRFHDSVGDEWSNPESMGLSIPKREFLSYLGREVIVPFFDEFKAGEVLEIGSGGGRVTELLVPECRNLIASDISKFMLSILRSRFKSYSSVAYLLLDGTGLTGVTDSSLDAVVSYDVFVHFEAWKIFNYLREIRRVLRPDGGALIHHANTLSELGWAKFCDDLPGQLRTQKQPQTFSLMSIDIMRELAERAGLRIAHTDTNVLPRDAITWLVPR